MTWLLGGGTDPVLSACGTEQKRNPNVRQVRLEEDAREKNFSGRTLRQTWGEGLGKGCWREGVMGTWGPWV